MGSKTAGFGCPAGWPVIAVSSLLLFSCSSTGTSGSSGRMVKELPFLSEKRADLTGFVYGRRLDGSVFSMPSAEVFLRNASVPLSYWNEHGFEIEGLTFEAKTDKDGKFEIQGLPFGKYYVLIVQPPEYDSDYCHIQEATFRFPQDTGGNNYYPHVTRWILNQTRVLKFTVEDERTGKPVKAVEGMVSYSELDKEKMLRLGKGKAVVALKEGGYGERIYPSNGVFAVRLTHNSRGEGFLRFLKGIVLTAPGYEWKEVKADWSQVFARCGKKPWVVKMTPKE